MHVHVRDLGLGLDLSRVFQHILLVVVKVICHLNIYKKKKAGIGVQQGLF